MSTKTLSLHPKQGSAFVSEATEILYGGSAGSGKSHLMRVAAIAWCFAIPGLQVYIFRRTHPDLVKNHLTGPSGLPAMLADWINAKTVKYNDGKGQFAFDNGSMIHMCHCQYEKDMYAFQGAEVHVLMIDELTHWPENMYRYLRGRVRVGGLKIADRFKKIFPRVLTGANPGGIGHNWVKMSFVDLVKPMEITQMSEDEGGMRRQYIPAKLADNPTQEQSEYRARLAGLGNPTLVKAMLDGDWNIVAGGMFDDVWDEAVHVLQPFRIPYSWSIDRSFDWGSSRPFSVGWWAESDGTEAVMPNGKIRAWPRETLFRINEWYGWSGKPNEGIKMSDYGIAEGIKKRESIMDYGTRIRPGPADSSIFDTTNEGDSPAKIQERAGVYWDKADKSPGSRKRGWSLFRGRLEESLKPRMESGGLFVFDSCRQFIRTIPTIPRDAKNPDDVDSDGEDHIADEARYRLLKVKRSMSVTSLNI